MRLAKQALISVLLVFGFVLLSALYTPSANAQSVSNPFCWKSPPPTEVDCNDDTWKGMIEASTGNPASEGWCYGFGFGVVAYSYDDPQCVKARNEAANQQPPQCYTFTGTSAEYSNGGFSRSALSSVTCDNAFSEGATYTNGMVYVKDNTGKVTARPDNEHELIVAQSGVQAGSPSNIKQSGDTGNPEFACGATGGGNDAVYPAFDIGCRGEGNPIVDLLFAIIRILTTGVGFALVGSIIIAGFEYVTAAGDPNKTAMAKKRLVSNLLVALPLYLLTYAILNWIVPGAIF